MQLTWKSVFLIWLLAIPFMAASGFLTYQQFPKPFQLVASATLKGVDLAKKQYDKYQHDQAKKKADEERKAKEAEQGSQPVY